jgi:NAD(P)H-dependent flavin oxidoreductase YrpB (nitropropane dioxygenase family)
LLASHEARTHRRFKERVLKANEPDTIYTGLFDVGWPNAPHRVIRNTTVEAWEAAGQPMSGKRSGEGDVIGTSSVYGEFKRYEAVTVCEGTEGDIEAFPLWAGQGVGLVQRAQPAGEIVKEIAEEARSVAGRLAACF